MEITGSTGDIEKLSATIQSVQDQIDGVVENWNGKGPALLTSEPAKSWIEKGDAEMIAHINDTYINIEEFVDDDTTPTAGHAWRWCNCQDESIVEKVLVTDKDGNQFYLHWHSIADSDAVRALKEAAEASKKVSDMEYLGNTFKDGTTEIRGGVVMSEMVAVKNEDGEIEAFLNGSDFAQDSEVDPHTSEPCGKLILAAGIPETTEGGSSDPEERAKEATTRIYEDGCTYTKNLHLQDGCTIGDLLITDIYGSGLIYSGDYNFVSTENPDGIKYTGFSKNGIVSVGSSNRNKTQAVVLENSCAGHALLITIGKNWMFCGDRGKDVGLEIVAPNAFAICIDEGQIAGLRPNTRTISGDTHLSRLDHTIMVNRNDTYDTRIYLPSNTVDEPLEVGQMFEIYIHQVNNTSAKVHLIAPDDNILIHEQDAYDLSDSEWNAHGIIRVMLAQDYAGNLRWWVYRLV